MRKKVADVFPAMVVNRVRARAADLGCDIPDTILNWDCKALEADHSKKTRNLAHVERQEGKKRVWIVCVHPALLCEPTAVVAGIITHELGHVMTGPDDGVAGGEPQADDWVRDHLGLEIRYDITTTLEFLDKEDMKKLGLDKIDWNQLELTYNRKP